MNLRKLKMYIHTYTCYLLIAFIHGGINALKLYGRKNCGDDNNDDDQKISTKF